MKIIVVIPAFNEAKSIQKVIRDVKTVVPDVIVIDDGSSDGTADLARSEGALVYQHILNRGLGGALGTGLVAALRQKADCIVTFDADGQHLPQDIMRMVQLIAEGKADVVIGSRLKEFQKMPFRRRLYNDVANIITLMLFGMRTTDSQSGLRAFSRESAKKIRLRTNKMEVSSEFMKEIYTHRLRFVEIPIKPIYTQYSMSKGQNFFVGIKTLIRLIVLRFMK